MSLIDEMVLVRFLNLHALHDGVWATVCQMTAEMQLALSPWLTMPLASRHHLVINNHGAESVVRAGKRHVEPVTTHELPHSPPRTQPLPPTSRWTSCVGLVTVHPHAKHSSEKCITRETKARHPQPWPSLD